MSLKKHSRRLTAIVLAAVFALLAQAIFLVTVSAFLAQPAIAEAVQDRADSIIEAITFSGGTQKAVVVVTETGAQSTNGSVYVNLPGATAQITVPATRSSLIRARFSAESSCTFGPGYCSVRIMINDVEMHPQSGSDFAFDSTDTQVPTSGKSHSMERVFKMPSGNAGPHTIQVQWGTAFGNGLTFFHLDDWTLTVERNTP